MASKFRPGFLSVWGAITLASDIIKICLSVLSRTLSKQISRNFVTSRNSFSSGFPSKTFKNIANKLG